MNRRTLLLLAIALAALIQARLLPEVGLETLFSLPLFVLLMLSSVRRRSTLIVGAFIAGFLLDALLWRPLGQTALALSAAVSMRPVPLCVTAPMPVPARAAGRAAMRASTLASIPSRLAGTGACAILVNTSSRSSISFTPPL